MKTRHALLPIIAFGCASLLHAQDIGTYELTISAPADGGAGPVLWYRDASDINNVHVYNSGSSAGGTPPVEPASGTNQAYRLGGAVYDDYFGNAGNAFGVDVSTNSAAIAGSTNAFMTGQEGSISLLFKTPSDIENASIFRQGGFELFLLGATDTARLTVEGTNYNPLLTVDTDTWYYFAARWNADQGPGDELHWYLGRLGGSLGFGSIGLSGTGVGASASIELGGRGVSNKFPSALQQVAIWQRELTESAIEQQFAVFQGSTSALEDVVRTIFPSAIEWAPGQITGAWIGDFSSTTEIFPEIAHPNLGTAFLYDVGIDGSLYLYLTAAEFGNCADQVGWVYANSAYGQFFYAYARAAWIYLVPNLTDTIWFYDYTSMEWVNCSFTCL